MSWHGHYQSEPEKARPRGHRGIPRDGYVSTCKRCLTGIFKDRDAYTWQTRPVPGYVHDTCLPGAGYGLAAT